MLHRSEKTRKLRELHGELTTLDTDIQQVEAQAGPGGVQGGPPAPPERPSEAELLRRRIAESTGRSAELPGHPPAAGPARIPPALPGLRPVCARRGAGARASSQQPRLPVMHSSLSSPRGV